MKKDFKILYIIGAGRSGTTLFDIMLGNSENCFSAGELNRFTKRDGLPHGARSNKVSDFWRAVNSIMEKKGLKNPYQYYKIFKQFEYHYNYFSMFRSLKSKEFALYSKYQQELFSAIYSTIKKDEVVIIDSSKYPLRGYFLSKIFKEKVLLLYIKRQPGDVVESFQKKDVEQPSKTRIASHIYLLVVNAIAGKVLKLLKGSNKTSVVYYNDFMKFPVKTFEKIERDLELDLSASKELINRNNTFKVGLLFDGNRLRLKEEIKFVSQTAKSKSKEHFLNELFSPFHKLIWYKN